MKKNGFTLLELLVVIGIIGILVALATVSYSSAQRQGRDARRKQDMTAIQNAMEQYYSDPINNFSYPPNCSDAVAYMKSTWPIDPGTGSSYPIMLCNATSYCICAALDQTTVASYGPSCIGSGPTGYYCVGNLQ